MAKSDITREPFWLNKSRMADSLGISVQAFEKWGVKPVAKIGREVFYDTKSVLENRLQHQGAKHQPNTDGLDPLAEQKLLQERLRLTTAQADAQERKNKVGEAKLVPVEFMTFALAKLTAMIGSTLDTIPKNLKRKTPDLEIRHMEALEREIAVTRNEAAGHAAKIPELINEFIASVDESAD